MSLNSAQRPAGGAPDARRRGACSDRQEVAEHGMQTKFGALQQKKSAKPQESRLKDF
jgi:hypothetical protein